MILLDTCALLWWTLDPGKLSPAAKRACDRIIVDGALISSISIWEIGIKKKKGILHFDDSLSGYVNRLRQLGSVEIIPVDEDIWVDNINLNWAHRDPADRTIVATAQMKNVPIVTKDDIIREYYSKIIW